MNTPTPQEIIEVKADAIFTAWKRRHNYAGFKILGVEKEFKFPLLNPETEAPSRSFSEAGKIDVLLEDGDGRVWVMEHKTTGDDIAPESTYWAKLRMDSQCTKYFLAALQKGHEPAGIIYNVLHRPQQRLRAVPLLDGGGFKIVEDSAGERVYCKDGKKPRESRDTEKGWVMKTRPETLTEFGVRISAEIEGHPAKYFGQREVPRLDSDLLEYMADAWACSQQILYFRSRKLWPRNTAACTAFGVCEFFSLCSGAASVDGITYRVSYKRHPELSVQSDGDKQLFTNSRKGTLQKCCRLHELRYERPTEKCGEEDEARDFGNAMHARFEAYFKALAQ